MTEQLAHLGPVTVRDAFQLYLLHNLAPLPGKHRTKDTSESGRGVYERKHAVRDLDRLFPPDTPKNIGVINGKLSGNLLDVDLDCEEARKLAPTFLPATGWRFGRDSSRGSHWIYRTEDQPLDRPQELFPDPFIREVKRATILELRGTGHWTVYPPSVHESGEELAWEAFADEGPSSVRLGDVQRAAGRLAVASLFARYWHKASPRHHTAMHLSGALLRDGWTVEEAGQFLEAVCLVSGDDEPGDRLATLRDTARKLEAGEEKITGWTRLAQHFGERGPELIRTTQRWLRSDAGSTLTVAPSRLREWPDPIPFFESPAVPLFPVLLLPSVLADWVRCEAEATQTPPDLAGLLCLTISGAGLAGKVRVEIRTGWQEPVNLFTGSALPPGDRKSQVFRDAMAPILDLERSERERASPEIAEAASHRRQLESRLKHLEGKAGKCEDVEQRSGLRAQAKECAEELANHKVPVPPRLFCDDVTPEKLSGLLADHNSRMLQASVEGTPFEIAKGRYSEGGKCNFEVYLRGHAGDPLRVDRIGRPDEMVNDPALSVALAVQPDVIAGLAEQKTMKKRGFLARFLYGLPVSLVGSRTIAGRPVPIDAATAYRDRILDVWRIECSAGENGRPQPWILRFSLEADRTLQDLERWIEPQLKQGEDLSLLAGWASKMAGACARIAAIFHVVDGCGLDAEIQPTTVERAISFGRDYLLPHAQAAFRLMGADERHETATRVWQNIQKHFKVEYVESVEIGGEAQIPRVSRRDLHQWNRRLVEGAEGIDPIINLLVDRFYLLPEGDGGTGRGNKGPTFLVNPKALRLEPQGRSQPTQRTQPRISPNGSANYEPHPRSQPTQRTQPDNVGTAKDGDIPEVEYVESVEIGVRPAPESQGVVSVVSGAPPATASRRFRLVNSATELSAVQTAIDETGIVAVDLETTGLNPRTDRVRLLSLACDVDGDGGQFTYVVDCFAVDPAPLWAALADRDLVIHNALFDLIFLHSLGFTPAGAVHDTMLYSRVLYAGARQKHTLDACCQRELSLDLPKELQQSDWSGTLTDDQLSYAARDVEVLRPLLTSLRHKMTDAGLDRIQTIERDCLPAVAWMSSQGVAVDRAGWQALADQAQQTADQLRAEMQDMAPNRPDEMFASWNFDSPLDMKTLFQALGVSLEGTSDSILARIDHPIASKLRDYREATKRIGTYGAGWLKCVSPDGRVYPRWNQMGAEASGRMSCSDPNMQQLPRDEAYRRCIIAPPGRVLVKADYSQIELRIAAKISGDQAMLDAYQRGEDLHMRTAKAVLRIEDVTKQDRQIAKALNFGLLFGMGSKTFRLYAQMTYGLNLSEEEAARLREAFFNAYPGLRAWHRSISDSMIATRTLAGRRRLGVDRFSEKLNSPVQGTGADGLKTALGFIWERREQCPGAFPVLAVHDEIVLEADQEQATAAAEWVKQAMLDAMRPLIVPVPVEVDVKIGTTWGGE